MSLEDVDVAERHIPETHDGTAIVHQLQHFVTAGAKLSEPLTCDSSELARLLLEPRVDSGIACHGPIESKNFFHEKRTTITYSGGCPLLSQEGTPARNRLPS